MITLSQGHREVTVFRLTRGVSYAADITTRMRLRRGTICNVKISMDR